MQMLQTINLWVVGAAAFVLGALAVVVGMWGVKAFSSKPSKSTRTRSLASLFDNRVKHFRGQVQTLSDHSNEYAAIFSGNEWNELLVCVERLENSNIRIKKCMAAKNYDAAQAILDELYDPIQHPLDSIQSNIDALKASAEWEDSVRGMLKNVIRNLEAAAQETRRINQDTSQLHGSSRKRTSTLVTLADVKKALLEDEAFKREQ